MSFERAHDRLRTVLGERDGENPDDPLSVQAMPLVLHVPHDPRPSRRALLEAAAVACVSLCLDDRAGAEYGVSGDTDGSDVARALVSWYGARIRKVARRARNKKWADVQSLPGVTAAVDGAEARAFAPCPVVHTPAAVNRLQIEGTDLPLPDDAEGVTVGDDHPVIYVDASLRMTVGKAAAQVAHGSMLLAAAMDRERARRWREEGFPLHVCEVDARRFAERRALAETREVGDDGAGDASGTGAAVVRDAGYTEVAPGSVTVVALDRHRPRLTPGRPRSAGSQQ
ncbi:peptidyl-tRNA hydrolase [Corynebacterium sp.]|uniref:peptidyl-tRNA hydrolase n=1 Tax=Corynebacterium sp. TaxID=1720 RepID=UPI0025B7F9A3|nr:peptidyl-tRNA hydrolase [Corynebacterium sp.]